MDPVLFGLEGQGFEGRSICCYCYGCQFCSCEGIGKGEEYKGRDEEESTVPAEKCLSQNHSNVGESAVTPIAGGGFVAAYPTYYTGISLFLDLPSLLRHGSVVNNFAMLT